MRRPAAHFGALALVSVVLVSLLGVAACRPSGNIPTDVPGTAPPATETPIPPRTDGPATPLPVDQLDTAWGPIWARAPDAFPVPPGGQPVEADTTVSAAWTVPARAQPGAREVAQYYMDRFGHAGLGGGLDGPLEDGSYTAWASNGYGCDILVMAQPRGTEETLATVLFGAGCPFTWLADG